MGMFCSKILAYLTSSMHRRGHALSVSLSLSFSPQAHYVLEILDCTEMSLGSPLKRSAQPARWIQTNGCDPMLLDYWHTPISFLNPTWYVIQGKPIGPIYAITLTVILAGYQMNIMLLEGTIHHGQLLRYKNSVFFFVATQMPTGPTTLMIKAPFSHLLIFLVKNIIS